MQIKKYATDLAMIYQTEKEKRKALELANKQLYQYAEDLKKTHEELKSTLDELQESHLDTIHRLVLAAEYKDDATYGHIIRIGKICELIGNKMGLPKKTVEILLYAAPMHDIGKIGIPDSILMKPGKLDPPEWEIMKTHTTIGANILTKSKSEILQAGETIAITHDEKWNGQGYPLGLNGEKIPLLGRIVALADVFDALTSERPYKSAMSVSAAYDIVKGERGQHFDPDIADIFINNYEDFVKIKNSVSD